VWSVTQTHHPPRPERRTFRRQSLESTQPRPAAPAVCREAAVGGRPLPADPLPAERPALAGAGLCRAGAPRAGARAPPCDRPRSGRVHPREPWIRCPLSCLILRMELWEFCFLFFPPFYCILTVACPCLPASAPPPPPPGVRSPVRRTLGSRPPFCSPALMCSCLSVPLLPPRAKVNLKAEVTSL